MSISIFEPVWPDNAIRTQRAPNSNFLHAEWAILMLIRLSLSPKVDILFVHVTTNVEICLVTEKWSPRNHDGLRLADWWFTQRHVSQPYLYRSEVVKSVSYTETGEDPVALWHAHNWIPWTICLLEQMSCRFPWRVLLTLSHSHDVIFCPVSRRRFIVCASGAFLPGKSLRNCRWVWTTDFVVK